MILAVSVETSPNYWRGYSAVHLERVIMAAASLAGYCSGQRYALGLISNGVPMNKNRLAELRPSRDRPQLQAVLEILATLQAISLSTMSRVLDDRMAWVPAGATVVLVAAYCSEDMSGRLSRLRARGHPTTLVYVGDAPPPEVPPGVILHDIGSHMAAFDQDGRNGSSREGPAR